MKKILPAFFAFLCLFTKLTAQPTLTSGNTSPKPGDSYASQPAAITGISASTGGANQNWNYSNLADSGASVGFQAVSPSGTPFAATFPGSNLVIKSVGDSVFSYFNSSPTALVAYGAGVRIDTDTSTIRYNPPRTNLPYPFTYNSSFTSPVSMNLPGFDFTFTGADTITGDGYGSLSIPGRTFSNVLRVKYVEDISGSGIIIGFPTTTKIRTTSYLYYSPDTHAPVLSYVVTQTTTTTTIGGNHIEQSNESTSIEYLKSFILPVTFQSFQANLQNKNVTLQWHTAQEINTDHFIVQRSVSGQDFRNIASVKANGNTQGSAYSYVDKSFAGGNIPPAVYYRIQSTDKDGKALLSDIVVVRGNTAIAIGVYPNPASHYIRILSKDASVADLIVIYDAKGSLVQQWRNYSISQPVSIANLAKGNYTVRITVGGNTTSISVIKQ